MSNLHKLVFVTPGASDSMLMKAGFTPSASLVGVSRPSVLGCFENSASSNSYTRSHQILARVLDDVSARSGHIMWVIVARAGG